MSSKIRSTTLDPISIAGKFPAPDESSTLVVIGAGAAGTTAAIQAAREGLSVVLVDEHPLQQELIGLDVPYYFGGRMSATFQAPGRMLEQILAANVALEEAYEAGVDVRLGTCAWGAFVNGPGLAALPRSIVGLSDGKRSWACGFDRLLVASGARDFVFSFEGCDQPGVLGARGFSSLVETYNAFEGRQILILGSGDLALGTAELALARGIEVVALVEVLGEIQGSSERAAALTARGVRFITSHVIARAERGPYGVAGAILRSVPENKEVRISCDTICLAVGVVPSIELLAPIGVRFALIPALGGYVPVTSNVGATSVCGVFVAGDAGGIADASTDGVVENSRRVVRAIVESLKENGSNMSVPGEARHIVGGDHIAYRLAWMRTLLESGGLNAPACQCEDVSRADLLGIQPPRYLGERSSAMAAKSLSSITAGGSLNPDLVKRLTRAGMGVCQGRRCREQIAMTIALKTGLSLDAIGLASFRAPVRPLPLGALAAFNESDLMRRHWDDWFGIQQQWVPYADIGTEREASWFGQDLHL